MERLIQNVTQKVTFLMNTLYIYKATSLRNTMYIHMYMCNSHT